MNQQVPPHVHKYSEKKLATLKRLASITIHSSNTSLARDEQKMKGEETLRQRIDRLARELKSGVRTQKEKAIRQVGAVAFERFGRSRYARQTFNTIPTSIVANVLKATVNFLLLYRMQTGRSWVDFCISMFVSMITAAISPIFYVLVKEREADLMRFSNHFTDQLMVHGVDYLRFWQTRIVGAVGACSLVFLALVEVDSKYLMHSIFEYLVSFVVVDQINQWRDSLFIPYPIIVKREYPAVVNPKQLTKYDLVDMHPRAHYAQVIYPRKARRARCINVDDNMRTRNSNQHHPMETTTTSVMVARKDRIIVEDWEGVTEISNF